MPILEPPVLTGTYVELVPMQQAHVPALWNIAQHEQLWAYMPFRVDSEQAMSRVVEGLLGQQQAGESAPFVTQHLVTGNLVGSTSYLAINLANKRLEIGATWVTPEYQRSPVNTEVKLLQLSYAFEQLHLNRVEFKTDALNQKSRAALARIGAQEEGTFRRHMVMPDGRIRDSVYFSIVAQEWPQIRRGLEAKLASG